MKPISEAELLEAIFAVLGAPSGDADPPRVVTRHSLRESRGTLRILLAEDNNVNQLVAARLLEKRGHTVVIAGNGMEALAAMGEHGSGGFDLILMDVQMPDMDGFEATAIIRAREKSLGHPSTDHRHDGPRHERRRGALPGCGDGRLRVEAFSSRKGLRGDRPCAHDPRRVSPYDEAAPPYFTAFAVGILVPDNSSPTPVP